MGTYVIYACHFKRQYIDPIDINGGSNKVQDVSSRTDLGALLLFLLSYESKELEWPYATQLADSGSRWLQWGSYESALENYEDITAKLIRAYNEAHPEENIPMVYTGSKEESSGEEEEPSGEGWTVGVDPMHPAEPVSHRMAKACEQCLKQVMIVIEANGTMKVNCGHHV